MLQKNLVFLSTITSVGTLVALFRYGIGYDPVICCVGRFRSGGDSSALAVGISEALYNTALGIGTSALALIMYKHIYN
ncbi:MAG: MotA/TolQ/ExbB proton channel family protein [Bacteroidota bacterium]